MGELTHIFSFLFRELIELSAEIHQWYNCERCRTYLETLFQCRYNRWKCHVAHEQKIIYSKRSMKIRCSPFRFELNSGFLIFLLIEQYFHLIQYCSKSPKANTINSTKHNYTHFPAAVKPNFTSHLTHNQCEHDVNIIVIHVLLQIIIIINAYLLLCHVRM